MTTRIGPAECEVCTGNECKGGGCHGCVQRDPRPSHVAGILDSYGGVRVVVAHKRTFVHHLRCGEFAIVCPNLLVHEPIAWGDIPGCVGRAEHEVAQWVERNSHTNHPEKREAIRAYHSRRTWHEKGSLDLLAIAYT